MPRVQKLDESAIFDNIQTGLKTTSTLPKSNVQQLNSWFNHFKLTKDIRLPRSKTNIEWVGTFHEKIHQYIIETYRPPTYKYSTLRFHLEALANILLAIDKNKYKEITRPMWNKALEHQKDIDEQRKENKLSDKEVINFVCYPDMVKIRDDYHNKWTQKPKDKKLNIYHLILALNTYIPPLRLTLIGMEFWTEEIQPPADTETNYMWIKPDGRMVMVINHDKIENKRQAFAKKKGYEYNRQMFDLDDEIPGVTNGMRLQGLIKESLKYFKRDYVLAGVRTTGAPMGKTSYDKALETIFKTIGKKPTQNLIRKSYVNHFYNSGLNMKSLEKIALRMRHSVSIAMLSYVKVNIPCSKSQVKSEVLPEKHDVPPPVLKREYFNPTEYSKQYRIKHADKLQKQRKENYEKNSELVLSKKVLFNLNHGLVKAPRSATIDKYKLSYNVKLKQWESDLF